MVATEIIPNMWLGDIRSALDTDFLKDNNITTIINCTVKYPFPDIAVNKIRVAVRDRGKQEDYDTMYAYLEHVVPLIYQLMDEGHRVLIHCYAGCHRSVCLVLGFLVKYSKLTLHESIDTLQSKWPRMGLNFSSSISKYYATINQVR
jgi:dual specificity phosphatase 12